MNNLESSVGARRVVVEVNDDIFKHKKNARNKRLRRRSTQNNIKKPIIQSCSEIQNDDEGSEGHQRVPLELWPIIQEILGYGKKTHALGAVRVASALSSFANKLRALGPSSPALEKIILDAEKESQDIRLLLAQSYEE